SSALGVPPRAELGDVLRRREAEAEVEHREVRGEGEQEREEAVDVDAELVDDVRRDRDAEQDEPDLRGEVPADVARDPLRAAAHLSATACRYDEYSTERPSSRQVT